MTDPHILTDAEKKRKLPWALGWSAFATLFATLTLFGPVFMLFLAELGLPKTRIGMLISIMPFCGPLALVVGNHASRFGIKRVFLIFWSLRFVILSGLLFTPWVVRQWGLGTGFLFMAAILIGFSIFRAIAETAYSPWVQEFVPADFRGRYFGLMRIISGVCSAGAVAFAGYLIGLNKGLSSYMWLFGAGVTSGLVSSIFATQIPGGAPKPAPVRILPDVKVLFAPLVQDRNFRNYIFAVGLVWLGGAMGGFGVLFMTEQVGLAPGVVVKVLFMASVLSFIATYFWGWISDHVGGKRVFMPGVAVHAIMLPLNLLIPRHSPASLPVVVILTIVGSLIITSWAIGEQRLLYNRVVPPDRSMAYMMLYYTWAGLVTGSGPLFAGWFLDQCQGIKGHFMFLKFDQFTPLFGLSCLLFVCGLVILRSVKPDDPTRKGEAPVSS